MNGTATSQLHSSLLFRPAKSVVNAFTEALLGLAHPIISGERFFLSCLIFMWAGVLLCIYLMIRGTTLARPPREGGQHYRTAAERSFVRV